MSSRTYLSIGDVLSLLREEFPDVTISKIRFLESQGLVNPERSPSGYRKFFEHDVERLRWVLRQQREHFLPLKVIRDRLAEGDVDETTDLVIDPAEAGGKVEVEAAVGTRHGNGRVSEPAHAGVASGSGSAGGSHGRHVAGGGGGIGGAGRPDDDALTQADSDAMARILADASRRAALLPDSARAGGRTEEGAANAPAAASSASTPAPPQSGRGSATNERAVASSGGRGGGRNDASSPTSDPTSAQSGKGVDAVAAAVAAAARGGETPAATEAAPAAPAVSAAAAPAKATGQGAAPSSSAKGAGAKSARPSAGAATSSAAGMVTGASLTTEELCAASGLSEAELSSLEGFGLISSVVVAGITTYDEDALTVSNLAAELRVFGIEPRHLRLYKNAVDREVGLIEQVIIPLLRQRNPEARQRAIESAEQLGTLGQTMRTTLLRAALRQHLGG